MEEYRLQFQTHWKNFISHLSAQIKQRGGKELPSHTQMNMILTDCALDWDSSETVSGRWLKGICELQPRKGQLIRSILVDDMQFRKVTVSQGIPDFVQILVPVLGAAAAFLIAWLLGAQLWLQIVCAAAAGILLTPLMLILGKRSVEMGKLRAFQKYIGQLDLFYQSILSVLSQ